jgi:predicted  nucleic acid-binding Zn-ribbon protein
MLQGFKNGKRLKAAIALVQRRKVWHPDEVSAIVDAADALLAERDTYARDEWQLLDIADKLRVIEFSAMPRIESPFDAKVAELAAPLEEAAKALQAAQDRVDELVEAQRKASAETAAMAQRRRYGDSSASPTEVDQALLRRDDIEHGLLQARSEAEADLQIADARWLRLNSRRLALQLAGDRWRAELEYSNNSVK